MIEQIGSRSNGNSSNIFFPGMSVLEMNQAYSTPRPTAIRACGTENSSEVAKRLSAAREVTNDRKVKVVAPIILKAETP